MVPFGPTLARIDAAEPGLDTGLDGETGVGRYSGSEAGDGLFRLGNVNAGSTSADSTSVRSLEGIVSDDTSAGSPPYGAGEYDADVCSGSGISNPVPKPEPALPRDLDRKRGGLRYAVAGSGCMWLSYSQEPLGAGLMRLLGERDGEGGV